MRKRRTLLPGPVGVAKDWPLDAEAGANCLKSADNAYSLPAAELGKGYTLVKEPEAGGACASGWAARRRTRPRRCATCFRR